MQQYTDLIRCFCKKFPYTIAKSVRYNLVNYPDQIFLLEEVTFSNPCIHIKFLLFGSPGNHPTPKFI